MAGTNASAPGDLSQQHLENFPAASFLRGTMRDVADYAPKFPIADLIVDWIKDKIAAQPLQDSRNRYDEDMLRRMFLFNLGWSTAPRPQRYGFGESAQSARRQALPVH